MNHSSTKKTGSIAAARPLGVRVNLVMQMMSMLVAALTSLAVAARPAETASFAAANAPSLPVAGAVATPLELLGLSGALRATIGLSDVLASDPALGPLVGGLSIDRPGI